MTRTIAVCGVLAFLCAGTIDAQRLAPAVLTSSAPATASGPSGSSLSPATTATSSYWLEGAVIGGLLTGVLSQHVIWGHGVTGLMIGVVPGVVLGAVIGASFPKE
jgi:hypothetical protein